MDALKSGVLQCQRRIQHKFPRWNPGLIVSKVAGDYIVKSYRDAGVALGMVGDARLWISAGLSRFLDYAFI